MRLLSGKRIGQSGQELTVAVFLSFLLHAIILFGAIFLYVRATPRIYVPPFYKVTLVSPSADMPLDLPAEPLPAPPPPVEKPKGKKPSPKEIKASVKKGAMPELVPKKKPAGEAEEEQPAESAGKPVSVAVATAQEFKFPPYLAIIRDKVERNWNPPPGAKGIKAKVLFNVLRSGRVGDAKLEESSGNFYFDQAAMRAILASSPFPPLPEESYKEYEIFSVDLMEKE